MIMNAISYLYFENYPSGSSSEKKIPGSGPRSGPGSSPGSGSFFSPHTQSLTQAQMQSQSSSNMTTRRELDQSSKDDLTQFDVIYTEVRDYYLHTYFFFIHLSMYVFLNLCIVRSICLFIIFIRSFIFSKLI